MLKTRITFIPKKKICLSGVVSFLALAKTSKCGSVRVSSYYLHLWIPLLMQLVGRISLAERHDTAVASTHGLGRV